MNIVDDFLRRNYALAGEYPNEIYFLEVTIDVVRNVSAFGGDEKLLSLEVILVDQVVQSSVNDLL
jgi:hypothetical protein